MNDRNWKDRWFSFAEIGRIGIGKLIARRNSSQEFEVLMICKKTEDGSSKIRRLTTTGKCTTTWRTPSCSFEKSEDSLLTVDNDRMRLT